MQRQGHTPGTHTVQSNTANQQVNAQLASTGIPDSHNIQNMQVNLENHYMQNLMLGQMNASDLEYNMLYFNNHTNNHTPNNNYGADIGGDPNQNN
mmetsp:Transcript_9523/g.8367  ORF Transcript_9523/g.8367 Transcript_9523/m.8367 type:complete len:95 (-) Transcript_9523:203-487(-)